MEETDSLKKSKKKEKKKIVPYFNTYQIQITTYIILLCIISLFTFILIIIPELNKQPEIIHYDYLIIGSGLFGSIFNYIARKYNKTTLIIERRKVVGGQLYCFKSDKFYIHKFGPRILHTNSKKIWDLANEIVPFSPLYIQPVTKIKDQIYSSSYNMWLFNKLWGVNTPEEAQNLLEGKRYYGNITNLEEQIKSYVGEEFYEKFFRYSVQKQIGNKCPNLPPFIIEMVPITFKYDNNFYYNDIYQGIPENGYTQFIKNALKYTEVKLNSDYFKIKYKFRDLADHIIFTGRIDEYYDYRFGELEYITVRYDHILKHVQNFQGNGIVNYPEMNVPYNKIIEIKHFQPYDEELQNYEKTILSYEYSEEWNRYKEPYYPLNDEKNRNLYLKYKELADQEKNITFAGKLATYRYYEIEDVFKEVLEFFKT
jgi:UDP-galactopyranose mutase